MAQLDYSLLGFTLTVADTAAALEIEPWEVRHLLITNDLSGVIVGDGPFGAISIMLHPDEVRAYAKLRKTRAQTVDSRNNSRALKIIHRYLAANPAVDDYDRAVVEGRPLLACSGHELAVHVRLEAVASFEKRAGGPVGGGVVSTSMLGEALTRAGGVRRKGLIAARDRGPGAKQRWGVWWRVPAAVLADASEDTVARQLVNGPMEPGEKVRVGPGGDPYLTGVLGGDEG